MSKTFLSGVFIFIFAAAAFADAEKDFQSLFGDQIAKARRTTSTDDDLELAKTLVEMSSELEKQKELKILMLKNACQLAARAPAGQGLVLKTTKLLESLAPDDAKTWREYRTNSYRTVYTKSRGRDRTAAGEAYIAALVSEGDGLAAIGEGAEASSMYNQALTIASAIQSKRRTEITDKIRNLAATIQKGKAFKELNDNLKKDPKDIKSREALIHLYLLDNDDGVSAKKLLTDDVDQALRANVELAAKAVSDVKVDDCRSLAEWYRSLAEEADTQVRQGVAYRRAYDYYDSFRSKHTKSDIVSLKAKLNQENIAKKLKTITVKLPVRKTLVPPYITAGVYWLMADDMDIYHNGKPLRVYNPTFRTRRDEARMTKPFSAQIKLRPGDVFTVGGRRGGSYGGTVIVTDQNNKLIWYSNTTDWKVYEPADPDRWYLPEIAMKSKQWPVKVALSFGHQLAMKQNYNNIPQPIWDDPGKRFCFMVGVYKKK